MSSLFLYFCLLIKDQKESLWDRGGYLQYIRYMCELAVYGEKNHISCGFSLSSHVKSGLFVSNILFGVSIGFPGPQQQWLTVQAF